MESETVKEINRIGDFLEIKKHGNYGTFPEKIYVPISRIKDISFEYFGTPIFNTESGIFRCECVEKGMLHYIMGGGEDV